MGLRVGLRRRRRSNKNLGCAEGVGSQESTEEPSCWRAAAPLGRARRRHRPRRGPDPGDLLRCRSIPGPPGAARAVIGIQPDAASARSLPATALGRGFVTPPTRRAPARPASTLSTTESAPSAVPSTTRGATGQGGEPGQDGGLAPSCWLGQAGVRGPRSAVVSPRASAVGLAGAQRRRGSFDLRDRLRDVPARRPLRREETGRCRRRRGGPGRSRSGVVVAVPPISFRRVRRARLGRHRGAAAGRWLQRCPGRGPARPRRRSGPAA